MAVRAKRPAKTEKPETPEPEPNGQDKPEPGPELPPEEEDVKQPGGPPPASLPPIMMPEMDEALKPTWGALRLNLALLQADLADAYRAAAMLAADPSAPASEALQERMIQIDQSYASLAGRLEALRALNKPNI